jgi:hypothetical protein
MSNRSRLVAGDRILDLAPLIHDERPVREDHSPISKPDKMMKCAGWRASNQGRGRTDADPA